jgi:predicted GNAT family acetyltransferase
MTADLAEFLAAVGDFLRSRLVENTLLITVADTLRARGTTAYGPTGARFGRWLPAGGEVAGAFVWTPPYPLLLTAVPDAAIAPLVESLVTLETSLSGVNAREDVAGAFAAAWQRRTDATADVHQRERLYRLGELAPPRVGPPGAARVATPPDRELLTAWQTAFLAEAGGIIPGDVASVIDDRISFGGITLWEVDGTPVSMAGLTRSVAGMVRIAPVYTPLPHRRRGYAAAVTATISQAALDAGAAEVLLFADLANPTSKGLYQRLGYKAVEDRVVLSFTAA